MSLQATGERSRSWRGGHSAYTAIHAWLAKTFPRTGRCEYCAATNKRTEYASIGHTYTRNRTDGKGGRGRSKSAEHRARISVTLKARPPMTHCRRGHLFDEENTLVYRGKRWCRACQRYRREEEVV